VTRTRRRRRRKTRSRRMRRRKRKRRRRRNRRRKRKRKRKRRRRRRRNCRVERASQQSAVQQFEVFANIEALVTSMRAERGYTTSVVILGGQDADANEVMFKQRSHTDYILLSLPVWPDGLAINNVRLTTRAHLGDMLNALRGRVSTLSVDFHDVLDFYSDITKQFMYWLLVINNCYKI